MDLRDGSELSFEKTKGKVVVLAFVGSWCPVCGQALPEIERMARETADDQLVVVAVAEQDDPAQVDRFFRRTGVHLPVVIDAGGELAQYFKVPTIPSFVVLDHNGVVRAVQGGFHAADKLRATERQTQRLLDVARTEGPPPVRRLELPAPPPDPDAEDEVADISGGAEADAPASDTQSTE